MSAPMSTSKARSGTTRNSCRRSAVLRVTAKTANPIKYKASQFPPITRTSPGYPIGGLKGSFLKTASAIRLRTEPASARIHIKSVCTAPSTKKSCILMAFRDDASLNVGSAGTTIVTGYCPASPCTVIPSRLNAVLDSGSAGGRSEGEGLESGFVADAVSTARFAVARFDQSRVMCGPIHSRHRIAGTRAVCRLPPRVFARGKSDL